MELEDLEGTLVVILSNVVYRRYRSVISGPGPYLVEGKIELAAEGVEPNTAEPFLEAKRISLIK